MRVVSLRKYRPSERFDGLAWIEARMEEGPLSGEGLTGFSPVALSGLVESVPRPGNYVLDPVEPDPDDPLFRDFTSTSAALDQGWYRIVFIDALGREEQTAAVRSPALPRAFGPGLPSGAEARALSGLLAAAYPEDDPDLDAALLALLDESAAYIISLTARDVGVGVTGTTAWGCTIEPLPEWMAKLAQRCVVMRAEWLEENTTAEARETAVEPGLKSFTAGPYSETYFDPGQVSSIKALDVDPALATLLWSLATQCAQDYWNYRWGGKYRPGVAVQTFEYRGSGVHGRRGRPRHPVDGW